MNKNNKSHQEYLRQLRNKQITEEAEAKKIAEKKKRQAEAIKESLKKKYLEQLQIKKEAEEYEKSSRKKYLDKINQLREREKIEINNQKKSEKKRVNGINYHGKLDSKINIHNIGPYSQKRTAFQIKMNSMTIKTLKLAGKLTIGFSELSKRKQSKRNRYMMELEQLSKMFESYSESYSIINTKSEELKKLEDRYNEIYSKFILGEFN